MNRRFVLGSAVCVLGLAAVVWPVYAQGQGRAEKAKAIANAMNEAKITLGKAVEAVETHSKGRAVMARAVMNDSNLGFNVEVVVGDAAKLYQVDKTGKVTDMPDVAALEKQLKSQAAAGKEAKGEKGDKGEKPKP